MHGRLRVGFRRDKDGEGALAGRDKLLIYIHTDRTQEGTESTLPPGDSCAVSPGAPEVTGSPVGFLERSGPPLRLGAAPPPPAGGKWELQIFFIFIFFLSQLCSLLGCYLL